MGRVRFAAAGDRGFRNDYYCQTVLVTVSFYLLAENSLFKRCHFSVLLRLSNGRCAVSKWRTRRWTCSNGYCHPILVAWLKGKLARYL